MERPNVFRSTFKGVLLEQQQQQHEKRRPGGADGDRGGHVGAVVEGDARGDVVAAEHRRDHEQQGDPAPAGNRLGRSSGASIRS